MRAVVSQPMLRNRVIFTAVAFSFLITTVGCGNKSATSDSQSSDSTTETTTPDPWLTEVATAAVPEVEVLTSDPTGSEPSATAVPIEGKSVAVTTKKAPTLGAIPRANLNSAGVRKTSTGFVYKNPTYFHNPLVFMVTKDAGDWLKVQVLARPNGQEGWIKRSDVTITETRTHIELTKATFHLKAFDGDTLVTESDVVIGKSTTPTPSGRFFLTEAISKPASGAYGPWVLAISAYSEALDSFDGGLPQVAFHGTDKPKLVGTQSSNGCVRMPNEIDMVLHDQMPPGTPITITP